MRVTELENLPATLGVAVFANTLQRRALKQGFKEIPIQKNGMGTMFCNESKLKRRGVTELNNGFPVFVKEITVHTDFAIGHIAEHIPMQP